MLYYIAERKYEILQFTETWMELEDIMFIQINQKKKNIRRSQLCVYAEQQNKRTESNE